MQILIDITHACLHVHGTLALNYNTSPGFNCSDCGQLVMKLRHGRVLVQIVRQSQRWTYTSSLGHEFCVTELKESNLRFSKNDPYFTPIPEDRDKHKPEDFKTSDVRYQIKHTKYHEVEVSIYHS